MSTSSVLLATARIRPGREAVFLAWRTRHDLAIGQFPGFKSSVIIPGGLAGSNEWTIVVNFQSSDQLRVWHSSEERAELFDQSDSFLDGGDLPRKRFNPEPEPIPKSISPQPASRTGGRQATFAGHERSGPVKARVEAPVNLPPGILSPNWRMTLLVLLGLFPVAAFEMKIVGPLVQYLPSYSSVSVFVGIGLAVFVTSFAVMPLISRAFAWWLLPGRGCTVTRWKGIALLGFLYAVEVAFFWQLD